MKKLISVFAAMALVGSMAAAPKKPAAPAAKPVVAAPVAAAVTAPTTSNMVAAGKALGLSFGLSVGYVTDMFKQGDTLKKWAGLAGGDGLKTAVANQNGAAACGGGAAGSSTNTCVGSGEGSNVSLNGLDFGLKVQYDILPWLFVRSGANYVLGMKNTYSLSNATTVTALGGSVQTNAITFTATGSTIEIPMLVGFNFVNNEHGALYMAAGLAYTSGTYETNLSATQTNSAANLGTALTYADVLNTTKQSGLGVMWLVGGKAKITGGVSIFGDVKFLSAAAAKSGAVTGTNFSTTPGTTGGYATANAVYTAASAAGAVTGAPIGGASATTYSNTAGATQTGTGGLDLSYTRWQIGVQYEL